MLRLSVLDQSPIPEGKTAVEALAFTGRLAEETEKLGYHRFWVAEHHFSENLAGASPEVLISHLAARTSTIRIGSGGVMLPHYSAYKVAENFRVLEALYPNRIDLGIGRAPGGMPLSTRALQEGHFHEGDPFPTQIEDLVTYLYDLADDQHRFPGLRATPIIETAPELWLLGSSGASAMLAAYHGAGYAFAHFINGNGGEEATRLYKSRFRSTIAGSAPHIIVAVFVVCAETDEEAERLASSLDLSLLLLEKGSPAKGTPSVEQALQYPYTDYDRFRLYENRKRMIVGSPQKVKEQIETMCRAYDADECMIVTITYDFEAKLTSYRLIAEAFGLKSE